LESPNYPPELRAAVDRATNAEAAYGRAFQKLVADNVVRQELQRITDGVKAAKEIADHLLDEWNVGIVAVARVVTAYNHLADLAERVDVRSRKMHA
jgi:predicted ATPase with chaperone activity